LGFSGVARHATPETPLVASLFCPLLSLLTSNLAGQNLGKSADSVFSVTVLGFLTLAVEKFSTKDEILKNIF
jgi:hypothetical protein